MTRFDVPSLAEVTGHLAGVAAGRKAPDLVITGPLHGATRYALDGELGGLGHSRRADMGFNLLPLTVIPEIRLTDKGLVLCPEMKLVPLFEPNL